MKGKNSMILNQSTMIEAVEYWLNKSQLTPEKKVKVTSVTKHNKEHGCLVSFEIKFEPRQRTDGA